MNNPIEELNLPRLSIPLFESGILYLCLSKEQWIEAHEALGAEAKMLDHSGASNTFSPATGGKQIYLLAIFDNSFSTAAHEAAHIVFDICQSVGITVKAGEANETFCYLLDHIMRFIEPHIKKNGSTKYLNSVQPF